MIEKKKIITKILISILFLFSLLVVNNIFVEQANAISNWDDITITYQYLDDKISTEMINGFVYNSANGYLVGFSRTSSSPTYNGSHIYAWYVDKVAQTITLTDDVKIPYHYNTGIYDVTFDGTYYHFACRNRIMAYSLTAGSFNLECDQAVLGGDAVNEGCHAIDNYGGYIFYGDDGGFDDGRLVAADFNGTAYNIVSTAPNTCLCHEYCSCDDIIEIECNDFEILVSRSANSCPTSIYNFHPGNETFTLVDDDSSVSHARDTLFVNGELFASAADTFRSGSVTDGDFSWVAYGDCPSYTGPIYADTSNNIFFVAPIYFSGKSCVYYYDYSSSVIERIAMKAVSVNDGGVIGFNDNIFTSEGMITYGTGDTYYIAAGDFNYLYVQVSNQMPDDWWDLYSNVTNLHSAFGNIGRNGTIRIWNGTYTIGEDAHEFTTTGEDAHEIYNEYVTVWGNGSGSGSENNTEITTDIEIHGDHNTFYELNFSGDFVTYGDHNAFIDTVFMGDVDVYGYNNTFMNCDFYSSSTSQTKTHGDHLYFENCTFYGNDYSAFWFNSDNSIVYNCDFFSDSGTENQKVVHAQSSAYNNTFINCVVTAPDDETAFHLSDGLGNTVYNCIASDITYGFNLGEGDTAYLCSVDDAEYGFVAAGSSTKNANITSCEISNCTRGINPSSYVNISGNEIVDNQYGIYRNTDNLDILGNHFINNDYGFYSYDTDDVYGTNTNILYNNFSSGEYGIYFSADDWWDQHMYFTIYNNVFWDSEYWDFYSDYLRESEILNNTFYSNGTYINRGWINEIDGNVYYNKTVDIGLSVGMHLYKSYGTTFTSNYVIDYEKGMYLDPDSSPSYYRVTIYNNYFDNVINVYEDLSDAYTPISENIWSITPTPGTNIVGGPYIAGNYWNDYYGYDTDGDYIGDTNTPHNASGYILGEIIPSGSYIILRPDGTGIWDGENFSQFTPLNGGDNYLEVDEEIFDENISYVNASSGNEMDAYSLENFSGGLIWNVSFHAMARATENECIQLGWGLIQDQAVYGFSGSGIPLTEEWTEIIEYSDEGACFEGEGCWCADWDEVFYDDIILNDTLFVLINDATCDGSEWCEEGGGPMTLYVSQVWLEVNLGESGPAGDEYPLVYFPSFPTNITGEVNNSQLTINWTKQDNADYTVIIRNESGYATTPTEGTIIYNSTGNTTNTALMLDHYYTVFGYNSSDRTFSYPAFLHFGAIKVECYNESNTTEGLNFDLLFRNESGSQTFNISGCSNPTWIDYTWIPYDTTVSMTASSGTYRDRTITADLDLYTWAHVIFYMNHGTLYYVKVIDEINDPIDDVYVEIHRYINGSYQLIGSKYTDPYGMAGFYLVPLTEYRGDFEKSGYNNLIETFDTDPYYYGYSYPIIFKLTYAELTPPDTDELFKNITWSLEPNKRYHNNSFTIFFNITSSDSQLEYFRMIVWYINETTGVNDLLNDTTKYTAAGGSINYTVNNITGKYKVDCIFKKDGFVETDVQEEGSRYYFISWGGLFGSEAFDNIPDLIFYIILIIIAAAITAFIYPFAGMGAGYATLGILAFGFVLKPVTVAGASCWAILAITALIYTIGLMLWSRI